LDKITINYTLAYYNQTYMADQYYDPKDLRKFGKITEWSEELGTKFFDYYGKVFEEGALTKRSYTRAWCYDDE